MRRISDAVWQERRAVVGRFEESGLSLAAFCRREGLAYWQLLAWRKRFGEERPSGDASFAELVIGAGGGAQDGSGAAAPVEVLLPGGATIRVHKGADPALLRAVAEAFSRC